MYKYRTISINICFKICKLNEFTMKLAITEGLKSSTNRPSVLLIINDIIIIFIYL